jgi:hypothetical protein
VTRPGLWRRAIKRILLALAATAVALALAEGAARLFRLDASTTDARRHHPVYGWTLNPRWHRATGVNRHGFLFGDLPHDKPAGTRRLAILGDSYAQGTPYPRGATFAGLLETWLNAAPGEGWEVLNFGVSGWGTAQELLALRHQALAYGPDALLLQVLPANDLCNNSLTLAFTCDLEDSHRPYFTLQGDALVPVRLDPGRERWRRSALFRLVEHRLGLGREGLVRPTDGTGVAEHLEQLGQLYRERSAAVGLDMPSRLYSLAPEADQPPAIGEAWRLTERLLAEIADELAARGIPLVVVAIPEPTSFNRRELQALGRPGSWPRSRRGVTLVSDYATSRVERFFARRGVPAVPLRQRIEAAAMRPEDHFYPYGRSGDWHLNGYGHQLTAALVLAALRDRGLTAAVDPGDLLAAADLLAEVPGPLADQGLHPTNLAHGVPARAVAFRPVRLAFRGAAHQPARLEFELRREGKTPPIVQVAINGRRARWARQEADGSVRGIVEFATAAGRNEIRFDFDRTDGLRFTRLTIAVGRGAGARSATATAD